MSESDSAQPGAGEQAAADALAAKLLAVQRMLSEVDVDPDVRLRLHLRYMAICASLKLPAADRPRAALRLDQLTADAERVGGGQRERRSQAQNERGNRDEKPGVN
jgi:hypothetical protein